MTRAPDRDPDADGVCGAYGPLQSMRNPARCQAHAGHEGEHYAYRDDGNRGPRWRTAYIPLEAPNGEVFFTLPPEGRRGQLAEFYRDHPQWRDLRELYEADKIPDFCREHGIGLDAADAQAGPLLPSNPKPASEVSSASEPELTDKSEGERGGAPEEPARIDPASTTSLGPYRRRPAYNVCERIDPDALEKEDCNRYWIDMSDTVHACQQEPDVCRERPTSRDHRHECACGKNTTGKTYPLAVDRADDQQLKASAETR